jgi:hypothetical protein
MKMDEFLRSELSTVSNLLTNEEETILFTDLVESLSKLKNKKSNVNLNEKKSKQNGGSTNNNLYIELFQTLNHDLKGWTEQTQSEQNSHKRITIPLVKQ